jgi:hypothetical protein
MLERHGADGSYDTTFGTGGLAETPKLSGPSQLIALGRQSGGKIVAAGTGNGGICVVRYWP